LAGIHTCPDRCWLACAPCGRSRVSAGRLTRPPPPLWACACAAQLPQLFLGSGGDMNLTRVAGGKRDTLRSGWRKGRAAPSGARGHFSKQRPAWQARLLAC
jgi:hypothetical protein